MKTRIDTHEGQLGIVAGQMREIWIALCHPQVYNSCESLQQITLGEEQTCTFWKGRSCRLFDSGSCRLGALMV
jgi:hypothetical protein